MADFWAGYISGAASIIIGNPLDLLKVRLQATSKPQAPTSPSSPTAPSTPLRGAQNLLAGLPAPILTYGALNALLFWSYNRSIALFAVHAHPAPDGKPVYPLYANFTAGCIAGLASFVFSAPTEVIKCRAQLAAGTDAASSSWAITKGIWQRSGITGLYHGGVITALRDGIGYGFYFLTYEGCTRYLQQHPLWNKPASSSGSAQIEASGMSDASVVLLAGGIAGVVTWASVFPLDVVKTRVQTQPLLNLESASRPPSSADVTRLAQSEACPLLQASESRTRSLPAVTATSAPLGAWQIAVQAYRTEGSGVFVRGLGVCSLRAFIVNAAQFWVYEWCMKAFQAR